MYRTALVELDRMLSRFAQAALAIVVLGACQETPVSQPGPMTLLGRGSLPPTVELQSPLRIAHHNGSFFVSDYLAGMVFEVEADLAGARITRAFDVSGPPLGVATAGQLLLVGNGETGSVDVYRAKNGKWLFSLNGITDPTDIAVDKRGRRAFVLDGRAGVVKVFDLKRGSLVGTISGPGLGEYDLTHATGIAYDAGQVIVSDYGDPSLSVPPRIKIFESDGSSVATFSGNARFSRPQGLDVDSRGRIVVVDAVAGEVHVLDRESGATVGVVGSFGTNPGDLWLPLDVVVDDTDQALVTSNRTRRVEVFDLGGLP